MKVENENKCMECGAPVTKRKDGTYWKKCFECNKKAKAENDAKKPTPEQRLDEIFIVFKKCAEYTKLNYPTMPGDVGMNVAMHLCNQYFKNERTPGYK